MISRRAHTYGQFASPTSSPYQDYHDDDGLHYMRPISSPAMLVSASEHDAWRLPRFYEYRF